MKKSYMLMHLGALRNEMHALILKGKNAIKQVNSFPEEVKHFLFHTKIFSNRSFLWPVFWLRGTTAWQSKLRAERFLKRR